MQESMTNILQLNRIKKLTKQELSLSNDLKVSIKKMVAKTTEEVLELSIEILKNDSEDLIIEECYDVINTATSLLYMRGVLNLSSIVENIDTSDTSLVTPITLLEYARTLNSYTHINTSYQSKTGLQSKEYVDEVLVDIVRDVVVFINTEYRIKFIADLTERKLNKWENKLNSFFQKKVQI
jgi:NTP pyrophosphatase (non-canonical NTP hydrolase)